MSRISIVGEEADECQYWLELMIGAELVNEAKVKDLLKEAKELTAIFTASLMTARKSKQNGDGIKSIASSLNRTQK